MANPGHDGAHAPLISRGDEATEYGAVTEIVSISPGDDDGSGDESDVQDGVRRIEAVSRTWTKWGLMIAYLRFVDQQRGLAMTRRVVNPRRSIFLMAFTVSLEGQVTYSLAAFAVSSFNNHSLLSTVYVIQGVVNGP